MAGEPVAGQIREVTLGLLPAKGETLEAPYSTYGPNGEQWSRVRHLIFEDGIYQAAWGSVGSSTYTIENNAGGTATTTNAQKAKWIYRNSQGVEEVSTAFPDILVTSREIFVQTSAGATVNVTPLYAEGTSACAGGTTTVTGVGTAWTTHRIKPGMLIRWPSVSLTWFVIATVGGNTSITLTANGPNTGGQIAYTIRRCFGGNAKVDSGSEDRNRLFCGVRNGNLYIAGNALDGEFPAVIEVADVLSNSAITAANSTYVLAQAALSTGFSAASIVASLYKILGMQLADDGRIFLGVWETAGTAVVKNRARWSTAQTVANWTGDGASFTDAVGNSGALTGVGRVSDYFSLHFTDGVTLAVPTGQDASPWDYKRTQAKTGTVVPETLTQFYGGDLYIGGDLDLYLFNGQTSIHVGGSTFHQEVATTGDPVIQTTRLTAAGGWACGFEGASNSFHLFVNWTTTEPEMGCHHIQIGIDDRRIVTHAWPIPITALGFPVVTARVWAMGTPSAWQVAGGLASGTIVTFRGIPQFAVDCVVATGLPELKTGQSATFAPEIRTNWLDFDAPGWLKQLIGFELWSLCDDAESVDPSQMTLDVESLPVEVNADQAGALSGYPVPYTETVLVRHVEAAYPTVSDNPPITRTSFLVNPSTSEADPPALQSTTGEVFRLTLSGMKGVHKLRVWAEVLGPMNALDSAP